MTQFADTLEPGRGKRLTLTLHIINVVFVTIHQFFRWWGGFINLCCFFFSHHKRRSGWMVRFFLVLSVILNFILLQMVGVSGPWLPLVSASSNVKRDLLHPLDVCYELSISNSWNWYIFYLDIITDNILFDSWYGYLKGYWKWKWWGGCKLIA